MTIGTLKAVMAGSAMLALGLGANAAQAATGSANAKAQILKAITVVQKADLDFGTIVTGAAAATVALTSAGALTCGVGLTCAGTPLPARFEIGGTAGQIVTVATSNASLTGPGTAMGAALTSSTSLLTLTGVQTTDVVKVGGVLTVGASQVEGVYNGSFTLTVNYQ
jgi:hypothetical protein